MNWELASTIIVTGIILGLMFGGLAWSMYTISKQTKEAQDLRERMMEREQNRKWL